MLRRTVLVALSWSFLMAQAYADPKPKVPICHFDNEDGTWVLINISAQGAAAHLRNHDDGSPDGVTVQSGTQLDANCEAAAPAADELQ